MTSAVVRDRLDRSGRLLSIPGWGAALADVCQRAEAIRTGGPASVRRLRREYYRLFVGPGRVPCPPYGSVYLDGLVMGQSTCLVAALYAKARFDDFDHTGPPDHIGTLLHFMAGLCRREAHATAIGSPAAVKTLVIERTLLRHHLASWVPSFARRIQAASREPFYAAAAALLDRWVNADCSFVESQLPEPASRLRLASRHP